MPKLPRQIGKEGIKSLQNVSMLEWLTFCKERELPREDYTPPRKQRKVLVRGDQHYYGSW
jgi:hypothetical protein